MLVRELIAALQAHDPEAEVLLRDKDHTGLAAAYAIEARPGIRTGHRLTDCDAEPTDDDLAWEAECYEAPAERVRVVVIAGRSPF